MIGFLLMLFETLLERLTVVLQRSAFRVACVAWQALRDYLFFGNLWAGKVAPGHLVFGISSRYIFEFNIPVYQIDKLGKFHLFCINIK